MTNEDDPARAGEAPRGSISLLSAAILRITASLDVQIVLREDVMSARALTGVNWTQRGRLQ